MKFYIILCLLFSLNTIYADMRIVIKNNLTENAIIQLFLLDTEETPIKKMYATIEPDNIASKNITSIDLEKMLRNNLYKLLLKVTLNKLPRTINNPNSINFVDILEKRKISRRKVVDIDSVSQTIELKCHNNKIIYVINFSINEASFQSLGGDFESYTKQVIIIPEHYDKKYLIVNVPFKK